MNDDQERCCGTCRWHWHQQGAGMDDWVCQNTDSDYCSDWTEFQDTCPDWEGKR